MTSVVERFTIELDRKFVTQTQPIGTSDNAAEWSITIHIVAVFGVRPLKCGWGKKLNEAGAGVLCCFHLQLWQRGRSGMGLFSRSCCVAFYSTITTTGAWPCGETGCFLVSYFLPCSARHIPASKARFLMHPDEGESQKVSVKQYESYNRGLALSDPSWLLIGWCLQFLASYWLEPEGVLSPPSTTEAQGRWEERGHVGSPENCAVQTLSRETCLPVGWRHHHPFWVVPRNAFLL